MSFYAPKNHICFLNSEVYFGTTYFVQKRTFRRWKICFFQTCIRVEWNIFLIYLVSYKEYVSNYWLGFCICSGQDHIVTHRRVVVATQQLESLLLILEFMVYGLITKMALILLTVILVTLLSHLRYFILHQLIEFFKKPYFFMDFFNQFCSLQSCNFLFLHCYILIFYAACPNFVFISLSFYTFRGKKNICWDNDELDKCRSSQHAIMLKHFWVEMILRSVFLLLIYILTYIEN